MANEAYKMRIKVIKFRFVAIDVNKQMTKIE